MKHLIIEGCDRTGKDSLIAGLLPFCQNAIVTHFSTPVGITDDEKRVFQEKSFNKEFGTAYYIAHCDLFSPPKPGKLNLIIWNRGHLGEFVYGNLYRQTHPEEWVMKLEEDYEFDKNDEIYLLLLTGNPLFLSSRDDGESFDASVEARSKEIANFKQAFDISIIKKKLELKIDTVDHTTGHRCYVEHKTIVKNVLQFLNT